MVIQRRELLVSLAIVIPLGLLVFLFAKGPGTSTAITFSDSNASQVDLVTSVIAPSNMMPPGAAQDGATRPTSEPTPASPFSIPTAQAVRVAGEKGEDLDDVLLLYDSAHEQNFDINFCQLARYYGVGCRRLDLGNTPLADALLRDARGDYFRLIGISARTLEVPSLVLPDKLDLIKQSVKVGGANLLVAELFVEEGYEGYPNLESLTDNAVLGAAALEDSHADWFISSQMLDLSGAFTAQVISCTQIAQPDSAIMISQELVTPREKEALNVVITSNDDSGAVYPIFVNYKAGAGSILVSSGDPHGTIADDPMRHHYEQCTFSQLVPLMFAFRFALSDEVWHNNHAYANLTIDDPPLRDHHRGLRYAELLAQMKEHNFHTTIAFEPRNYKRSDPVVAHLFLANPDYLSIVQHGNNSDLYEFYKYEVSQTDPYPARPLAEQKVDIIEGLVRMEEHKRLTGVPYGKIMIFPYGISPAPTLVWLKANNFNVTINANHIPLGSESGDSFDFDMYQAVMDYGNFPSIKRMPVPPGGLSGLDFQQLLFGLFIGKPILLFSHADEVFRHGLDGFNQTAGAINQLPTAVEWHSLDYIVKRLYLEKVNDDGSIDVKWYGNHIIVINTSNQGKTYHLQKEETLNVSIASLTINGEEFPFRVKDDTLLLDFYVPARTSAEVVITYGL